MRLLAQGRTADVYALDTNRVLRRYRNGTNPKNETRLMRHLHSVGFPVPEVFDITDTEIVMSRVHGNTMLQHALEGGLTSALLGETLAELHNQLHFLVAPSWMSTNAQNRILHMDFHPENILLTSDGPVVIDWTNAESGDPRLDVADTAVLLRIASASVDVPQSARERLLDDFLGSVAHNPVDVLPEAITRRLADPAFDTFERAELRRWLAQLS